VLLNFVFRKKNLYNFQVHEHVVGKVKRQSIQSVWNHQESSNLKIPDWYAETNTRAVRLRRNPTGSHYNLFRVWLQEMCHMSLLSLGTVAVTQHPLLPLLVL